MIQMEVFHVIFAHLFLHNVVSRCSFCCSQVFPSAIAGGVDSSFTHVSSEEVLVCHQARHNFRQYQEKSRHHHFSLARVVGNLLPLVTSGPVFLRLRMNESWALFIYSVLFSYILVLLYLYDTYLGP